MVRLFCLKGGAGVSREKFQELAEKALETLGQRECPVCGRAGMTVTLRDVNEYFYRLDLTCGCGASWEAVQCSSREDESIILSFNQSRMEGWRRCGVCSLPYGPQEASVRGGIRYCPGCGSQESPWGGSGNLAPEPDANGRSRRWEFLPCPECPDKVRPYRPRTVKYTSSTEYRDGMTGDYTRTTEELLGFCPECGKFYFLSLEESTKFGIKIKLLCRCMMPEPYARRILSIYGIEAP